MLITIPVSTDAPIYHWPFATGGLIVFNSLVLVLQYSFSGFNEWGVLHFGTINPITWFTSMCMHGDVFHLLGNMIFLALLGWIVEGKIGWWRFLIVYFVAGVSTGALIQIMMIFGNGTALGASGAIFGLLAIAMVWAPENEVRFWYAGIFFFYPVAGFFDVGMSTLAFVMIGLEFVKAAFTWFSMSSALAHLLGAIPGFVIGYCMIKFRMVDCEGYDLISTLKGKRGERVLTIADEEAQKKRAEEARIRAKLELDQALEKIEDYVSAGHYEMALNRFEVLRRNHRGLVLTEFQLARIINAYDANPETKPKTISLLKTYLEHYQNRKIPFTLMLARNYVLVEERPRQGLKMLDTLHSESLDSKLAQFAARLRATAERMIEEGHMEVDD